MVCRKCKVHGVDSSSGRGHACAFATCACLECVAVERCREVWRRNSLRKRTRDAARTAARAQQLVAEAPAANPLDLTIVPVVTLDCEADAAQAMPQFEVTARTNLARRGATCRLHKGCGTVPGCSMCMAKRRAAQVRGRWLLAVNLDQEGPAGDRRLVLRAHRPPPDVSGSAWMQRGTTEQERGLPAQAPAPGTHATGQPLWRAWRDPADHREHAVPQAVAPNAEHRRVEHVLQTAFVQAAAELGRPVDPAGSVQPAAFDQAAAELGRPVDPAGSVQPAAFDQAAAELGPAEPLYVQPEVPLQTATSNQVGVELAAVEEAPVEQASVEEAPFDQASVEEAPFDQASVEEAPFDQASVEQVAVEEASIEQAAVQRAAVEETPVEQASIVQASVEEAPVEQMPTTAELREAMGRLCLECSASSLEDLPDHIDTAHMQLVPVRQLGHLFELMREAVFGKRPPLSPAEAELAEPNAAG